MPDRQAELKRFSTEVRKLMKAAKINDVQLAGILSLRGVECGQNTVNRWRNGVNMPRSSEMILTQIRDACKEFKERKR